MAAKPLRILAFVIVVAFLAAELPDLRGAQADVSDADLEAASAARTIALGSPASGGRVTTLPLETYVARVLAGEAERDAPDAELQALAVAIRTFAIFNLGRHHRDGFDLCDTTHCQVPRAATAATRRAASATAGRILTYQGAPAEVFYSASCGGRSESAAAVWPGMNLPYLTSVVDDVHGDDVPWTLELTLTQIRDVVRGLGFEGARLTDVRVDERSESGRVARLRLRGLQPDAIAGDAFRLAIGPAKLRSTAFTLERHGEVVAFTGRGYGHGVGLCVVGAGRRARRGESADDILAKYYPGLVVSMVDRMAPRAIDVAASPSSKSAAAPYAVTSGVIVRVPKGVGITAAELERAAVQARDAMSRALGASVAPITIEVHDSVDHFRAATGKPWWVSAVASGTTIDLEPPHVLEQRDGIDVTLRRAMAALLLEPELAGRPAWIRVGAARYFSRPTPPSATSDKVRCPSNAELTLAISAIAQRDAESRAEACFARAIGQTGDWRTVR